MTERIVAVFYWGEYGKILCAVCDSIETALKVPSRNVYGECDKEGYEKQGWEFDDSWEINVW